MKDVKAFNSIYYITASVENLLNNSTLLFHTYKKTSLINNPKDKS